MINPVIRGGKKLAEGPRASRHQRPDSQESWEHLLGQAPGWAVLPRAQTAVGTGESSPAGASSCPRAAPEDPAWPLRVTPWSPPGCRRDAALSGHPSPGTVADSRRASSASRGHAPEPGAGCSVISHVAGHVCVIG